jgi:SAM-dependent methyltransferase
MNEFSETWFAVFAAGMPPGRTTAEVAFLARHLPRPGFTTLLDVCCGHGRHAHALAADGYEVLGVDVNARAIATARRVSSPRLRFVERDMRDLRSIDEQFDGALNLWHSFGYFDDETNAGILTTVLSLLRPGGRLIIDLYNRDHLLLLPPREAMERNGMRIETRRSWEGNRHRVHLTYGDGAATGEFEWRIYSPAEVEYLARAVGFDVVCSCAWFSESRPPSSADALMQFVLQRPGEP